MGRKFWDEPWLKLCNECMAETKPTVRLNNGIILLIIFYKQIHEKTLNFEDQQH